MSHSDRFDLLEILLEQGRKNTVDSDEEPLMEGDFDLALECLQVLRDGFLDMEWPSY